MKNAFEIIQPTFEKTKELLFPIKIGLWAKLAFIALLAEFCGGLSSYNYSQRQLSQKEIEGIGSWLLDLWMKWWKVILVGVFLLILFWFVMAFLSSVFKFIFYDGITRKETSIRASFSRNLGIGVSLFRFMLLLGIVVLSLVVLFVVLLVLSIGSGAINNAFRGMGVFIISLCFLCCLFVPLIIVALFIIEDFTMPIMYLKRKGFLASTGQALHLIGTNFVQFLIYIVARIALGIAFAIIGFILLLPLLIPLFIIFFIVILTSLKGFDFTAITMRDIIVGIAALIPISIIIGYIAQLLTLPLTVFSRFFPLMFLRELDPELNFEV